MSPLCETVPPQNQPLIVAEIEHDFFVIFLPQKFADQPLGILTGLRLVQVLLIDVTNLRLGQG